MFTWLSVEAHFFMCVPLFLILFFIKALVVHLFLFFYFISPFPSSSCLTLLLCYRYLGGVAERVLREAV